MIGSNIWTALPVWDRTGLHNESIGLQKSDPFHINTGVCCVRGAKPILAHNAVKSGAIFFALQMTFRHSLKCSARGTCPAHCPPTTTSDAADRSNNEVYTLKLSKKRPRSRPVILNLFAEAKSRLTTLFESCTEEILTSQLTRFVL